MVNEINKPGAILIIRPEPQASDDMAYFTGKGLECLKMPVLSYEDMVFAMPQTEKLDAIIATSARSFSQKVAFRELLEKPVYCVGTKTSLAAKAAGFSRVINADGDAGDLLDILQAELPQKAHVLYLRGEDVSVDVAASLKDLGHSCLDRITYSARTVENISQGIVDAIQARNISVVAFYSARTARQFITLIKAYGLESCFKGTKALCISGTVLEYVRVMDWAQIVVAARPTGLEMRRLCVEIIKTL